MRPVISQTEGVKEILSLTVSVAVVTCEQTLHHVPMFPSPTLCRALHTLLPSSLCYVFSSVELNTL